MSRKLWNPDDLDAMRQQSDPVGDEVVASFGDEPALAATLLNSLVRTGEPTEETSEVLREYRNKTRQLPAWADRAKIRRAQELMSTNLIPGTILLAAASLPQCYLDHRGTPVLAATHQLTDHVFRRLIQTSHLVFTVYDPGSLFDGPDEPDAIPAAIHKAQTVRLIHALMRHLLLQDGSHIRYPQSMADVLWARRWDSARLGKPINQEDEAFVLLTFSHVVIEGFGRLALVLTDQDKEAVLHLWNVVGFVLGINESLMAHTYEDAQLLYKILMARLRGPSESGQRLTKALVDWINGLLPAFLRWFDAGGELITFLNGEDDAAMLGVKISGTDQIAHIVIERLLPPLEKVERLAGNPHPFHRLANYLAERMIDAVWKATENSARQIDWPIQVRQAAGR